MASDVQTSASYGTTAADDVDIEARAADATPRDYDQHSTQEIARIITSGADDEYIHIGNTKVLKSELINAFGGDMRPGLSAPPSRKFANPSPLGLSAFALTTFVLSLVNVRARHVESPSILIGLAFFYGGVIQLLAGMWEVVLENTFGATALSSYGGFWLSWAAIETDAFGIVSAYGGDEAALSSALGFYLIGWFIFTFMLCLCSVRSTVAFFGLFAFLDMTFLLLACGAFTGHEGVNKAGGWFGIITAFLGWYNAYAGLSNKENSYLVVKPIFMPGAQTVEKATAKKAKSS